MKKRRRHGKSKSAVRRPTSMKKAPDTAIAEGIVRVGLCPCPFSINIEALAKVDFGVLDMADIVASRAKP
jgi:hypothetical protein